MHKLIEYICDELEDIEKKSEKGKLSMAEVEYADKLAHLKKNLLRADELEDEGYSGARYQKRDSRGRYSSEPYMRDRYSSEPYHYSMDNREIVRELHTLMNDAPEDTKMEFKRFIQKIENM